MHSALSAAGPRAQQIAELMTLFVGVTAVVYLVVVAVLMWVLWRKRAESVTASPEVQRAWERRSRSVIAGSVSLTILILVTLALADFFVQRSLSAHPADAIRILVTGHQYWWEVEYEHTEPNERVRTANEIYIPTGRPVEVVLTSRDVIHSFWLPSITGKKDLIPGHTTTEVLLADRQGTYSGQCAEFCGLQHANMKLMLQAVSGEQYEAWRRQQLAPGREPSTPEQKQGLEVFSRASCVLCHSVQGTSAAANIGPDLTHLASRRMIAAGSLENTPANLASWITAPHRVKPGTQMPATPMAPEDLAALIQYLTSLQ